MTEQPSVVMRPGLGALLTQFSLHLQLLRVEWEQEKSRYRQILALLLVALSLFLCTVLSLSVLVITLGWDTPYRLHSMVLLLVLFGGGTLIAWYRLSKLLEQGSAAYADSRQEMAADFALLRSWLNE